MSPVLIETLSCSTWILSSNVCTFSKAVKSSGTPNPVFFDISLTFCCAFNCSDASLLPASVLAFFKSNNLFSSTCNLNFLINSSLDSDKAILISLLDISSAFKLSKKEGYCSCSFFIASNLSLVP